MGVGFLNHTKKKSLQTYAQKSLISEVLSAYLLDIGSYEQVLENSSIQKLIMNVQNVLHKCLQHKIIILGALCEKNPKIVVG